MARVLELLAPARNADIGIAAIDSGADAVYIAGPAFGARAAAGNELEDIARLCNHAHKYGARVFATVNTILYDSELKEAESMLQGLVSAGVDALIVQDMAVAVIVAAMGLDIALHASTQCAISDVSKARLLAESGFSRLILERQMSLEGIKSIHCALPDAELEFFVHGALCVGYSGQCYLSEYLTSRSANRGACSQACRARYDLVDSKGRTIVRDKSLLSLKDYRLIDRLPDLASCGVTSFKIEGRLKNESYVRNVVRAYSEVLDQLVESSGGKYLRRSFGHVRGSFSPELEKTFNRGYTELFIDGKRTQWAAMDAAKGMGEHIGTVISLSQDKTRLSVNGAKKISNGDGMSFVSRGGEVVGFRVESCEGENLRIKALDALFKGAELYRNVDVDFERRIASNPGKRLISVAVDVKVTDGRVLLQASSEDGRTARLEVQSSAQLADNQERAAQTLRIQLSKTTESYEFMVKGWQQDGELPFMRMSDINEARRVLASMLEALPCNARPLLCLKPRIPCSSGALDYRGNVSNALSRDFYTRSGYEVKEPAYELTHKEGACLLVTKQCVRHELGFCLKQKRGSELSAPLYLVNNRRRLELRFDCSRCEMSIIALPRQL